ncbi:GNAT family N-acetyltransferase [Clostridium sp. Mt-5]|uniref:GNAT family N-acetyltransferase n=1 Tax=Clostridium moutaii TaxID=3240932 RepID=A0ABV4BK97_9CLOT
MEEKNCLIVSEVRSFSRFYTKILGLLNQDILDSPYSLIEARILFEIGEIPNCTSNILVGKLNMDPGYISRILGRFNSDGLITKEKSSKDGRYTFISLTSRGKEILLSLSQKSNNQIIALTNPLTQSEREKLVESMKYIKNLLSPSSIDRSLKIRTYKLKDINYIIEKHKKLYKDEFGFSHEFADYVEKYLIQFHKSHDEDKENIWIAEINGKPSGVIAIAKADDSTAQLRWFLIEPEARYRRLGHTLLQTALDFSRKKNYNHIFLWTADVLKAARHLYKSYGFNLTESKNNTTWTDHLVKEERWDLYF